MEQGKNELQQAVDNNAQSIAADAGGEPSAEEERRARVFNRDLATVGLYLSGAYLVFLVLMGSLAWDRLWQMRPNEFGDLMAGVFAPLAFLWLVLGFFQQGAELRNSAKALWLQMDELRNSVEQQRGLVEATRDLRNSEREIFEREEKERQRAAQPVLRITPAGGTTIAGNKALYDFRFNIRNVGASCSEIVLRDDDGQVRAFPKMENGGFQQFGVPAPRSEVSKIHVDLSYLDSLHMPRSQQWVLTMGPDGHTAERLDS